MGTFYTHCGQRWHQHNYHKRTRGCARGGLLATLLCRKRQGARGTESSFIRCAGCPEVTGLHHGPPLGSEAKNVRRRAGLTTVWCLRIDGPSSSERGDSPRHDSGGDPEVIPDLTFEQFQDFHAKYYHPSNARCGWQHVCSVRTGREHAAATTATPATPGACVCVFGQGGGRLLAWSQQSGIWEEGAEGNLWVNAAVKEKPGTPAGSVSRFGDTVPSTSSCQVLVLRRRRPREAPGAAGRLPQPV